MELRAVRLTDPEVAPLLADLAAEYERRYGPGDEIFDATVEEFDAPAGAFLVLVDEGETVAGGGIRPLGTDVCEVKRMWTAAHHRRRGHARTVLSALEDAARRRGYSRVRLETGPAQPEALALYRRMGYSEIPMYGRYEVATAFERHLAPTVPG